MIWTNPMTGFLAGIYQFAYPPQFDVEVERWRVEISARVNDHSTVLDELARRLASRLVVSDLAVRLGIELVKTESAGLQSLRDYGSVCRLLPDVDESSVQEAIHELEHYGLLTSLGHVLAAPISHVRLAYEIYQAFDLVAFGFNTIGDGCQLAQMILDDAQRGNITKLFTEVGWPHRRFNPGLACLLQFFEPGLISRESQDEFPTTQLFVGSRERFRLKQFIAESTP
jgi:hypothetical protein